MNIIREALHKKEQTAEKMYWLIEAFHTDLEQISLETPSGVKPLSVLSPEEFFDFVRKIPYKRDTRPVEVIARPYYLIKDRKKGLDCKKKSILMGSYFRINGIPFRLIGSSSREDEKIHHVFIQGKIAGKWENFDCTYSHYRPYEIKHVTQAVVL